MYTFYSCPAVFLKLMRCKIGVIKDIQTKNVFAVFEQRDRNSSSGHLSSREMLIYVFSEVKQVEGPVTSVTSEFIIEAKTSTPGGIWDDT